MLNALYCYRRKNTTHFAHLCSNETLFLTWIYFTIIFIKQISYCIFICIMVWVVLFQKSAFSKYQKQGVQCLTSTTISETSFGTKVAFTYGYFLCKFRFSAKSMCRVIKVLILKTWWFFSRENIRKHIHRMQNSTLNPIKKTASSYLLPLKSSSEFFAFFGKNWY